jgi:hypothetical protein
MPQDLLDLALGGKIQVPNDSLAKGHVPDSTTHEVKVDPFAVGNPAQLIYKLELGG